MIFVTGGAYQGKTAYVTALSGNAVTDGAVCKINEIKGAMIIKNYHLLVKRLIREGKDPILFTEKLCENNPECIIIMDEIGCGIIPAEKSEREWREKVGRCGCIIAEKAETVIRVICGIPQAIKGKLP